LDWLPASRSHVVASGFTARRATPKVGRNDPCPCGSGKKYKKCCADKERGEAWSPVAGISMREYRRRLHEFLTPEAMLREHPADLARLPLEALSTAQLDAAFSVFLDCERMEDAERTLEVLATRDLGEKLTLDDLRAELVTFAHDWGHDELVERHLALFSDPAKIPRHVALGRELRRPTERTLALLERECRAHVVEGAPPPMELAYELLEPYPALGIVLARGCLDPEHAKDSETLLAEIEWARDRLGAPPDDPAWALWDLMVEERRLAKAADEEKAALRQELERMRAEAMDARAEAQVLVRELGKHREQLAKLEAKAAEQKSRSTASAKERAAQAADAEAARNLRRKIRELEERIREGQRERAELRRRAEEVAKRSSAVAESEAETELEEEAGEEVTPHGLRVPVWSAKARDSLEKLPAKVAAAAIAAAGALGAGRPEAWRHAKRLEGMHGLCSARVGIHHRLLFRMDHEGELDVEEVVTREDLDRALAARR
ncbi:MAG TPA: SEC-C metal-binding domain-containing protein, partial [Sandaracinaceae bacterium]